MKNSAETQVGQTHSRAVIWIDHLIAKVFSMGMTGVTPSVVHAHLASQHLHHKANTVGSGRVEEDPSFLEQVAKAVALCREVLIVGPGTEKTALLHHLQSVYSQMVLRLDACDHPTDAEIIALGRKHFHIDQVSVDRA
ncbi:hypothetical protein [Bradyrhizobium sp.]|uniref:hypothetical protein n=1 Tax=Bradyrhizobium sp. TaxID=376 RepID=UPI00263902F8|nr:hypothetical protein [Bradyrhizobium sp.]